MLKEKVEVLHRDFRPLRYAFKAIEAAKPVKEDIEKVCVELRAIIEGGELAAVDQEIRTAITSVYNIFESASKGLKAESVVALFDY